MTDQIKFYEVNKPYGCFSNFSKHPVYIDWTWPTTEHFFQAQKFLDKQLQAKILSAKSAMEAARMGRNKAWQIRTDWEEVKDEIMRTAIRAKVRQHADVRETLLGTGAAIIIEHSANDSYWADGGDGSGRNVLGKILMEIRAELTKDGPFDELANASPPPWIAYPHIPRYSMGWRMGDSQEYSCEWEAWYGGLSLAGKQRYRQMHPEPEEWAGYLSELKR